MDTREVHHRTRILGTVIFDIVSFVMNILKKLLQMLFSHLTDVYIPFIYKIKYLYVNKFMKGARILFFLWFCEYLWNTDINIFISISKEKDLHILDLNGRYLFAASNKLNWLNSCFKIIKLNIDSYWNIIVNTRKWSPF